MKQKSNVKSRAVVLFVLAATTICAEAVANDSVSRLEFADLVKGVHFVRDRILNLPDLGVASLKEWDQDRSRKRREMELEASAVDFADPRAFCVAPVETGGVDGSDEVLAGVETGGAAIDAQ